MHKINVGKIIIAIIIPNIIGSIGALFTTSSLQPWYESIVKPSFTPPSWLFSPVWITLYTLMGISLYLIWNKGVKEKSVRIALWLFAIQLILNGLWSYIFFTLHNPLYAFIELIVLIIFILATIIQFWKINKIAAYLLIPYLLWSSFAAILNYSIWQIN